jgi:cytochrome c oxidase cbb3-type subunit III
MNVRRSIRWVGTFIVVLSGLTLHPPPVSADTGEQSLASEVTPTDLANGKQLYISSCSRCHGVDGSGSDEGPNLHDALAKTGERAVADTILKGKPGTGMPAFSTIMSASDASHVAAYMATLGRVISPAAVISGNVRSGETIFKRSGCQKCHTIAGVGGNLGPELTNIGSLRPPDKLRQALLSPGADLPTKRSSRGLSAPVLAYLMFRAVTKDGRTVEGMRVAEDTFNIVLQDVNGDLYSLSKPSLRSLDAEPGMSFMPSVNGVLLDAELTDLIAYLASLKGAQ